MTYSAFYILLSTWYLIVYHSISKLVLLNVFLFSFFKYCLCAYHVLHKKGEAGQGESSSVRTPVYSVHYPQEFQLRH